MIKALLTPVEGATRPVIALFGLSEGNIALLREGRPIRTNLQELDESMPNLDILICWGATEAELIAQLHEESIVDENTRKIHGEGDGHLS